MKSSKNKDAQIRATRQCQVLVRTLAAKKGIKIPQAAELLILAGAKSLKVK